MEYDSGVKVLKNNEQKKKEEGKLNAFKDHLDALNKHINNTQMFLNKETSIIDQKIVAIQALIVK